MKKRKKSHSWGNRVTGGEKICSHKAEPVRISQTYLKLGLQNVAKERRRKKMGRGWDREIKLNRRELADWGLRGIILLGERKGGVKLK